MPISPQHKPKSKAIFWIRLFLLFGILVLLGLFGPQLLIVQAAKGRTYHSVQNLPSREVGLVLGTSKYAPGGRRYNVYYLYRMNAAAEAFHAGKVKTLILSGDNSEKYYDEPKQMQADLIKRGVPSQRLVLDYAGFRTLDSVIRAKKIFGQNKYTIISQKFHNERALFLAQASGVDAIALNAQKVVHPVNKKVQMREFFARIQAVLDIIIGKQPKFLGKPESMPK